MSDFLIGAALVLLTAALILGCAFSVADSYGEFEYHTASGQMGTAEYCVVSYGQARCRTADGEVIVVEQYRKLK